AVVCCAECLIGRCTFCVSAFLRSAFLRSAFCVLRSAFCVERRVNTERESWRFAAPPAGQGRCEAPTLRVLHHTPSTQNAERRTRFTGIRLRAGRRGWCGRGLRRARCLIGGLLHSSRCVGRPPGRR